MAWGPRPVRAAQYNPDAPSPEHLELVYTGSALVTRVRNGLPESSSSDASLVARMIEALNLAPGLRVLEVGAGTGYNAALISQVVGNQSLVVTVDYQVGVVEQTSRLLTKAGFGAIVLRAGDGFYGAPDLAPFDRIAVTVGSSDLSPHWVDQLDPAGSLIAPLRQGGARRCPSRCG